ncbi:type II secretion system protein [Lysinibacillus sp. CNPSo 3705]|uniref:type IV pilus modification PilV family protein n=1 Tax=Lysinibacillus sp. CNPSo 3705 TaxID=3028148 RepID=UPI0023638D71|nr:type II secretion system protein [Lysinibacillus sp. CNPSo 3705]MDD1502040.1 type II secretion system protein [Lysinibacillus sp. CNPSo 3705]
MLIKSQRGFSLIEVVASLVLISIILLSFAQIFISTNKTATVNTEKLVTVNLADAVLAKLKSDSLTKIATQDLNDYFNDTGEPDAKKKNPPLEIDLNGKTYAITYTPYQNTNKYANSDFTEKDLNLIKVVVTVTSQNGKTKGSSEGYVSIE